MELRFQVISLKSRVMVEVQEVLSDCKLFFPESKYCTDNGAMVAFLGEIYMKKNSLTSDNFTTAPNLSLKN